MAKKQTRRSISVRGVTYNQLRDYCAGVSLSMSDFIEQRIADFFAARPVAAGAGPVVIAPAAPLRQPMAAPHLVDRRPAPSVARVEPMLAAPAPRPVPAQSAINRPLAVAARRAVSQPAPPAVTPIARIVSTPAAASGQMASATGRPAPTPAANVLKERLTPAAPRDAKDYRAIRF